VAGQGCAQHHAAKSGHRQFAKVASRQGCVSNDSSLFHVHSFLPLMIWFNATHTEVGPMKPPFYSREEQKSGATNSSLPRYREFCARFIAGDSPPHDYIHAGLDVMFLGLPGINPSRG